jgi:hypothetical protein
MEYDDNYDDEYMLLQNMQVVTTPLCSPGRLWSLRMAPVMSEQELQCGCVGIWLGDYVITVIPLSSIVQAQTRM